MKIPKIPDLSPDWNETQFTNKFRDAITCLGGYSIKLGASQFMQKGTPDTYVTIGGVSFLCESKVHPYKPTPIQKRVIRDVRDALGCAWIITLKDCKIFIDTGESFEGFLDLIQYVWNFASTSSQEPEWNGTVLIQEEGRGDNVPNAS